LKIEETLGAVRQSEPVTVGVPFPQGMVKDVKTLSLIGQDKMTPQPLQTQILSRWHDKSVQWLLLDFFVNCPANETVAYYLKIDIAAAEKTALIPSIQHKDTNEFLTINTGKALFTIDKKHFQIFQSVKIGQNEWLNQNGSKVLLIDAKNNELCPIVRRVHVETAGDLRTTVYSEGEFLSKDWKLFLRFFNRLTFYAGSGLVKVDFTIRNPKAAEHKGGLWDLGDKGSVYFHDLSFNFSLASGEQPMIFFKTQLNEGLKTINEERVKIYQDSSGGENWQSVNHINRNGKATNTFCGYHVESDRVLEEGLRAWPTLTIVSEKKALTASIFQFWQNFPKSLELEGNTLVVRLFPKHYADLFELQGGEQKTHTFYIHFDQTTSAPKNLDWIADPLTPKASPQWYIESRVFGSITAADNDKNSDYQRFVEYALHGKNNFFAIREQADEYGWRHYGEIYANHEIAGYRGDLTPFISHYNNQYDAINGFILQFARSGNLQWHRLMSDLAKHVIDVDIYHTQQDRPVYNGGQFWHTDHFMHAQTSTHRSFSRKNIALSGNPHYGGGPSNQNCYTTGLCNYYYLTGNPLAYSAVIELANWNYNQEQLEKNVLGVLRKIKYTVNSLRNPYAKAPGRGEANAINALIDAFMLSENKAYLRKAEQIIKKHISPYDNIERLNRQKIEARWFYLIFLQAVGKYLDLKNRIHEEDKRFHYAKNALLHHAKWMLKHEEPYKTCFDKVEIPSSTWTAQDIRKCIIFQYAFKYAEDSPVKTLFKDKAEFFYNASIRDSLSFEDETWTYVRPLVIFLHYGAQCAL
jgi:hypothetical protein